MQNGQRNSIISKEVFLPQNVSSCVLSLQANKSNAHGSTPSIATDVWKDMSNSRTSYNYTNLVSNGDFSNGATGWFIAPDSGTNIQSQGGLNDSVYFRSMDDYGSIQQNVNIPSGAVIYCRYYAKIFGNRTAQTNYIELKNGATNIATHITPTINSNNIWNKFSFKTSSLSNSITKIIVMHFNYVDGIYVGFDEIMIINLTALGLQDLSTAQCDELFAFTATTGVAIRSNDALLLNQAKNGTTSGFIISETINGKTIYQNRFDGTDDYANIVSTASLDVTTNELVIAKTFRIPTGATTKWILNKSEDAENETQYGLKYNAINGNIELWLEGDVRATTNASSITQNVWYNVIFYRNTANDISVYLNKVAQTGSSYVGSLTSRANLRIGARSSNAGGTTHTDFAKQDLATLSIYSAQTLNINQIIKAEMNVSYPYTGVK